MNAASDGSAAFGTRMRRAMDEFGPFCAGLDPHASLLTAWGLGDDVDGLARFTATAVEAFAGEVAAVKPQAAFFERFGARGMAVLEQAICDLRAAGTLVVLDVKRGDIGSTAQAYADAYLDQSSPMAVDAVTVSPYLGLSSVDPFLDTAATHGAGVFVLALTSNPGADRFQHARTAGGDTVAGEVLAGLAARNRDAFPLGSFGAVVGATIGTTTEDLAINGPLLAPGYGAQGATMADLRRVFGPAIGNVVVTSSRDLLAHGPDVASLRSAARRSGEAIAALIEAGDAPDPS